MLVKSLLPTLSLAGAAVAASADEWRTRSIYQVIVDRFAKEDGSSGNCNLKEYCGGSWKGLVNKLDYIQDMGFTAVSSLLPSVGGVLNPHARFGSAPLVAPWTTTPPTDRVITVCQPALAVLPVIDVPRRLLADQLHRPQSALRERR